MNHLHGETSPYLLQHADNPVDWYPWSEEAFARAKRENKPVFLSIGYSTCHWCHVMARESFEDEETARLLNAHFIAVKVDREERPDIDSVYMAVCQAFTGSGGWPTSLFLTPDQKPFFAGTYFPPQARHGLIGFRDLLRTIARQWADNRPALLHSAEEALAQLSSAMPPAGEAAPHSDLPERAVGWFSAAYDEEYGGFGDAPKFPTPHNLLFLLAYSKLKAHDRTLRMAETTLTQMRRGGIFDQIGYGFSRYSTDRYFLAPHFEKMLYDNALLILAYAAAYAATGSAAHLDTAEKTADYVLREMTSPAGAFYAAQDADSGGVEGRYYLFHYDELLTLLGDEKGRAFNAYYGITPQGNFEGGSIPNRLHPTGPEGAFDDVLPAVRTYRRERDSLHLDDKILTAWNALMIAALAFLYRITGAPRYLDAAKTAQRFLDTHLSDENGLYVSFREGKRTARGFLDEYAFSAAAQLMLFDATLEEDYLRRAEQFCRQAASFADPDAGGFHLTGDANERLVIRPKETYDGALPSGNAVMAFNFVLLSQLTQEDDWEQAALRQLAFLSGEAASFPAGHSLFLLALLLHDNPPPSVTVVLGSDGEWESVKKRRPLYATVRVLPGPTADYPLLNSRTTYYVCRAHACLPPSNTLAL